MFLLIVLFIQLIYFFLILLNLIFISFRVNIILDLIILSILFIEIKFRLLIKIYFVLNLYRTSFVKKNWIIICSWYIWIIKSNFKIIIFVEIYHSSFLLTTIVLWSFYLNYTLFFISKSNLNLLPISIIKITYFTLILILLLFLNLKLYWIIIFSWGFFVIKNICIFLNCIVMIFFRLINLNIYYRSSASISILCSAFLILVCCFKFIY